MNILFTSVGRRVALVRHFKETLRSLSLYGNIVTVDNSRSAPAAFLADYQELVPRVSDPNYISRLKEICSKHEIELLIPLIDSELTLLSNHRDEFAAMGVTVLVSSPEVNEICYDKTSTYMFFKDAGIDTPELLDPDMMTDAADTFYPIFLKPKNGSRSVGATKINNRRELDFFKDYIPNVILQPYIEGQEFTLDVLAGRDGKVLSVVPRLRLETRDGEVSKAVTVKHQEIIQAGKRVVEALPGAFGCITVQCFYTKRGEIKFIEINPRFGGGIPLSLKAGADFPRWILQMLRGEKPSIAIDDWEDGVAMLRYDDAIFSTREIIL